jgi:hypothetical protein
MKNYEVIVAEAVRVEYCETDGKLYIVFEAVDEKFKQYIKSNWTKDLEYRIIDKNLVSDYNE